MMGRYISVPTEIEAVQFDGENFMEVRALAGYRPHSYTIRRDINAFNPIGSYLLAYDQPRSVKGELWVEANRQILPIEIGEWIIRDAHGCYPCKDDIFRQKYREL